MSGRRFGVNSLVARTMKTMRAPRRFSAITRSSVALLALGAACADNDHTDVCLGPGCTTYEGIAGRNSLTAGNFGGFGGADAGTTTPDAAAPPEPQPDSGTPPPPDPCEVAFLSPLVGDGGGVTLAADDDVDGEACGRSFSARVLVLSNASQVNLFVNDNPLGSVPVSGGVARFDAALGNRGQIGNALRAEATMADGRHCSTLLGASVFVGCAGPSCSIDSPLANRDGFLNQTDDDDDNATGLQTDIVVVTELENAQTVVRLELDADFDAVPDAVVQEDDAQGSATFPGVTLAEGPRTVRAECRDEFNVVTLSPIIEWNVDISACSLEIESIAGGTDPITAEDDLDESPQNGLDVLVRGTIEGDDCDTLEIGECSDDPSEISLRNLLGSDGGFIVPIKVPAATASLALCARVKDGAGNPNAPDVELEVNVRADSPSVAIESPASGTRFNLDGTSGAIADLNPSSQGSCEIDVVVDCSDVGVGVDLLADGDVIATQPCVAQGGLAAPFSGRATFGGVSLASNDDGSTTALSAVQTAQGVASLPASVAVQADCEAPLLSFSAPPCNAQLALTADDTDTAAPGLQFDVNVINGGIPDVVLTVLAGGSTDVEASGDSTSTEFSAVDLGGPGNVSLVACATDPQGNQGCAPSCALTVTAEPSIAITDPRPPAVFTIEDDCDTRDPEGAGLQILVAGTSSATNGSPVEITIGSGTPSTVLLASGSFTACVQAPDGEDQTLTATVTDTLTELSSTATVIVSTNTSPPPAIAAPSFVVTDRRVGTLDLTWSSVLDASGDPLAAYHLRCSRTNITTESIWSAATVFPVTIAPALTAGVAEAQGITGFRTGLSRFCMVRGQDAYGQLSPLSPLPGGPATVAAVSNPFSTLAFNSVTPSTAARVSVSALGDINGDGVGDLIYGTQGKGAQVFFGGTLDPITPADRTPDVEITLPGAQVNHEFGANVAGLGDVNGDGLADFAVTARALTQLTPAVQNGGSVFVFFGKPSSSPWPATISAAANPGCGADLCFHSSEALAGLGSSVTSTDFDGVSPADIVIGAQSRGSLVGRVYVILGGSQLNVGGSPPVLALPADNPSGFIIDPTSSSRNFGVNVAGVGVGSDTRGDLVISALGRSVTSPTPETVNGEAFFVAGRALSTLGLTSIAAGPPFAVGTPNFFGSPMRAVGDVNNDGFGDVWVSTNFDLNGVAPVYLGRSTGYTGVSLFGFTNDVVDNEWGSYVATGFHTALGRLGDVDNNGFDDVLVGSIFANGTPGSADLFYSDSTTQNRTRGSADAHISSTANGLITPGFVGDVTGDGFRDIAILDSGAGQPTTGLTLLY
jgi:hypothetical protein